MSGGGVTLVQVRADSPVPVLNQDLLSRFDDRPPDLDPCPLMALQSSSYSS
jgi:hypothetical protein